MSSRFRTRAHVCASATLATCLMAPAAAWTVYDDPVNPPLPECNMTWIIPDERPRARPVLLLTSLTPRAVAQQLPGAFPTSRQVAYTINFSNLNQQIPQLSGDFSITQVRARVYAGPTSSHPMVADQTRTDGTASIAWSATATEGRSIFASYQSKWLVTVQSTGKWKVDEWNPWLPASVTLACNMTVKPPSTTQPFVMN